MFEGFLASSIIKRAIGKKTVDVTAVNIRDFTEDRYHRVDTPPVGGGAGLVMKCQPLIDAIQHVKNYDSRIVLLSPRGVTYNQKVAKRLANYDHLVIICGHYEGIDERVNAYVDEMISIGDYILTGGEVAAMAIADSIIRLQKGVIANESLTEESFENNLLEYPQYTEPYDFHGQKVPDILYSGNHSAIAKWRRREALRLTKTHRPDLFKQIQLTKTDLKLVRELESDQTSEWENSALEKGAKFIKK
jgi:tRNA (guanine37-N1)-methyltransferase